MKKALKKRLKLYKPKVFYMVTFFVFFLLGFFLRAQEVLSNNYLFLLDMGRDMLAVKGIIYDFHPTLIGPYTSLAGVFQGPLYYYLIAIPSFILKGNPLGPLILMLIISLLSVILAFYFSKKYFGIVSGLFIALLFSVSPEAIAASTYTWNPHPMWLLIVLFTFLFYRLLNGNEKLHLFVWPVIGLMFHFEAALGFFIGITSLLLSLIILRKQLLVRHFLIGICICSLTFSPLVLFDLRHEFLMTKSVITLLKGGNESLFVKGESLGFFDLTINHANTFISNYISGFPKLFNFNYTHVILFIGTILSFIYTRKNKKLQPFYSYYKMYFAFLSIFLVLLLFYPYPLRYWFFTGFQTFHIIAVGISFALLWRYKIGKIIILLLLIKLLFYSIAQIDKLYFNPPNDGGFAKVRGKLSAIEYIYKDSGGKDFNFLIFTPPVLTDAYDYLVWWYGSRNYNYIPGKEKAGVFYLLIEPDGSNPWSYKGWLETVVKTGTVLETVNHPSGLIIQKRIQEIR